MIYSNRSLYFARPWSRTRSVAWVRLSRWEGALNAEGLSEGWGRRRSTMERTNQQTGMHRPWGDFCVYRSALTPGAKSECSVQRVKGMRALSVLCLPFPPFLANRAALFPILLVLRPVKVRPKFASRTSTPSSLETAFEICLESIKQHLLYFIYVTTFFRKSSKINYIKNRNLYYN